MNRKKEPTLIKKTYIYIQKDNKENTTNQLLNIKIDKKYQPISFQFSNAAKYQLQVNFVYKIRLSEITRQSFY